MAGTLILLTMTLLYLSFCFYCKIKLTGTGPFTPSLKQLVRVFYVNLSFNISPKVNGELATVIELTIPLGWMLMLGE